MVGNLNTWVEWCVGVSVFVKNQFSRWTGVVVLAANVIAQLLMMRAYPFWSLTDPHARHPGDLRSDRVRPQVFLRRKRHPARDNPRLAANRGAGSAEAMPRQAEVEQLMVWRRSAQRVTRSWNAWLAAESRDRDVRYRVFVAALAGEESAAAELERLIYPPEAGRYVTAIDARKSGLGAR